VNRSAFPTQGPRVAPTAAGALDPYRQAIRRHPWIVGLVVLVTLAAGIAYTRVRTPEYHTSAQILVTPAADDPATIGLPILTDSVDPTRTLQTASTILTSPRAALLAARALGGGMTVSELRAALAVTPQGNQNVVGITATSSDPQLAARMANAYATAALRTRKETLGSQVSTKLASVTARQKALSPTDTATAATLAGQASTLQSIADGQDPNFSLLQSAAVPAAASGKSTALIVVLALLVGLALGTGFALLLEQLDRRIRDEDELSDLSTLPVLARLPQDRRASDHSLPAVSSVEALRALQIQLEARARGSAGHVVVVTSASEGDGKTTSAIALAQALASSGRRVVLLDFDLRKCEIGARLGVRSDLLRMLRTDGRLADVLVPASGTRNLRVMSPPAVGDGGALFDSYTRQLPALIDQARSIADFVIVDTAPLGRVADALRLLAHADDVLLVARPGTTDRREFALTQETLDHLGIIPTGLVLVGGTRGAAGYYGFSGEIQPTLARVAPAGAPAPARSGPTVVPGDSAAPAVRTPSSAAAP
jgi:Mrp family chromosome partitioning ATPase